MPTGIAQDHLFTIFLLFPQISTKTNIKTLCVNEAIMKFKKRVKRVGLGSQAPNSIDVVPPTLSTRVWVFSLIFHVYKMDLFISVR